MKQVNREELLDVGHASKAEVRRSLADLRRINALPGGTSATVQSVARLLNGKRDATILDIGTGSGDAAQAMMRYSEARGLNWKVIGVDLKGEHLRMAREITPRGLWLQADAFRLPFADKGVDCVSASLLLHHFRSDGVMALMREFDRVSRVGWTCSDLVRARPPLVFFALFWPVFARSYLTRFDARASIRRSYTASELRDIAKQSGVRDVEVRGQFAFRASVSRRK